MGRKRKSGIDYWLENCNTCSKLTKTKFLEDGVDNGGVRFTCSAIGEDVAPHKIDGCKHYDYGNPTVNNQEISKDKGSKKGK